MDSSGNSISSSRHILRSPRSPSIEAFGSRNRDRTTSLMTQTIYRRSWASYCGILTLNRPTSAPSGNRSTGDSTLGLCTSLRAVSKNIGELDGECHRLSRTRQLLHHSTEDLTTDNGWHATESFLNAPLDGRLGSAKLTKVAHENRLLRGIKRNRAEGTSSPHTLHASNSSTGPPLLAYSRPGCPRD
jgi:hypothetical protein